MGLRQRLPQEPPDPLDSSSAPPPVTGERAPIGVPSGYTIPTPQSRTYSYDESGRIVPVPSTTLVDKPPTYFDGDDWVPSSYSAVEIFQLQTALAKVGLLRGTWSGGYWDDATRKAYRELLGMANSKGSDADPLLNDMLAQVQELGSALFTIDENGNIVMTRTGEGTETRAPLVTRTTDPASLRNVFRRSVIELLGEGWSEDQINKMVAAYNSMEVERQTAAYNAQPTGGTVQDIPTPEAFIESEVQEQDPTGVQANQALGFASDFMQLAGSTAWGVG